jgi:putative transposase
MIMDRNTCLTTSRRRSASSASRVRPKRFIRTLKENLLWVRTFETIEELRQALLEFRQTYNTTWLIERHGFLTPAQFRQKQLQTAAIAA